MDLGLALPKAAVFMSGPEMRRAFRRVPPALRLRSGREIFKRPVREGGFAGRQKIEQNKNFVQFGGRCFQPPSTFDRFLAQISRQPAMSDYRTEAPEILRDFLSYHETIKAHSQRTVDEYYLDLRNFFRYMKQIRDPDLADKSLDEISIMDVDLEFVGSIKLSDIYSYMTYLSRDRVRFQNSSHSDYGLNAASRARKIATIRSFYNYLTNKAHLLRENPVKDIDAPKLKKELPRYLTLEQSKDLLSAVDGKNQERDYAILTLFLNCGLRISELVGLNLQDIQDETMRILGKGNKVRILYLNDACQAALNRYLAVRRPITGRDANALFLSSQNERISRSTVHAMVKKRLLEAGLDATQYSSHKLRHTAATLMLQNGVDVRAVQEVLGHDHLNTTEIYTHIDNEALRVAAKANPLSKVDIPKRK